MVFWEVAMVKIVVASAVAMVYGLVSMVFWAAALEHDVNVVDENVQTSFQCI